MEQALAQLARTVEQLEIAVASFPPDFDLVTFSAAWYSKAPEERNRAMVVRSNMDDLHNLCQNLIDRSVRLAQEIGAIPADRKTPASEQLQKQGLYGREVEEVMREVVYLRNSSQHEYWMLTPEDVHGAVNRQRLSLPSFIAGLGVWVQEMLGNEAPSEEAAE